MKHIFILLGVFLLQASCSVEKEEVEFSRDTSTRSRNTERVKKPEREKPTEARVVDKSIEIPKVRQVKPTTTPPPEPTPSPSRPIFPQDQLFQAAERGDKDKVSSLVVQETVDVNGQRSSDGKTALHIAAENHNVEMIKILLKNKANKLAKDHNGDLPLHLAAKKGSQAIARLLSNYVVYEVRNKDGLTATQIARKAKNYKVAWYLETEYRGYNTK